MCQLCFYSIFCINLLLLLTWNNGLYSSKILSDPSKQSSYTFMLFLQMYCIVVIYSLYCYFPDCKAFIRSIFVSLDFLI